jgi:hypothetical protein
MFRFLRVRRARTVVEQIVPTLLEGLKALPEVERACTMAIANAMLLAAAKERGSQILSDPYSLEAGLASDIVMEMAGIHGGILHEILVPLHKRNMGDVMYAQSMRQIRAMEVVMVTIGGSLAPEVRFYAREGWKILWSGRNHGEDAASTLIQFAKHARSRPLPSIPGKQITRADIVRLAASVPPFLRKKKRAAPARKITKAR